MRRFAARATAFTLAFVMAATPLAAASEALGHDLSASSTPLSQDAVLGRQVFWSDTYSDLRTEHTVTYRPGGTVEPVVSFGGKVLAKATLDAMARELEAQGRRVVSGINGDYYVVATGQPLGLVVSGGEVKSSDGVGEDAHYAVGFRADGSAFIGAKPNLRTTLNTGSAVFTLAGVNKVRSETGAPVLLTQEFHTGTANTSAGINVVLAPVAGQSGVFSTQRDGRDVVLTRSERLLINGRVTCTVESVTEESQSTPIPEGKFVLTMNAKGDLSQYETLRNLVPGQTVDIDITAADPIWTEAVSATGALYKLLEEGKALPGLPTEQTARSAIGIKADGTVVFYTIDGKQPGYSVGATLTQVAQRLIELGCVEAACLDGGGSTTLGVTAPDSSAFAGLNRPSDGRQRANSTAIFLTSTVPATGVLDHLYVSPGDGLLLSGAQVRLKASGVDTAYYPTALSSAVEWSVEEGLGFVDQDGLFTAGPVSETASVTAVSGGAAGAAVFTVVDTPDTLTISRETGGGGLSALYLAPGEQVDLKGTAIYNHLPLTAQDTCFVWTADPAAGTVDENGVFTAADKSGAGTLTVSAGLKSVMIPVVVSGHIRELETFEQNTAAFTAGTGMTVESESAPDYVARGRGSLRLGYDASAGAASAASTLAIPAGEKYLSLWVYGDGSGNQLTATVRCGEGQSDLHLTALNFTGWRRVEAPLPEGADGLAALRVIYAGGAARTGTVWLDHLTCANEALTDTAAPAVTITREGNALTAVVADQVDRPLAQDRISLTVDGKPQAFTWKAETGTLTATLAVEDGKSHRITVTARDSAGNLGRASLSVLPQREESPFVDTDGHWAAPFAQYLHDMDVSHGAPVDGGMAYYPNNLITRGEAFTMIARWMVDDLKRYENVELPFDDADTIPAWALNEVKAMVALGMVKGGGGKLNFSGVMSRTEAMVLLGRTQAKGYASADLSGFSDGGQVPAWAADYVRSLVGQGIVNGSNGWLNPLGPITRGEMAKLLMDIQ